MKLAYAIAGLLFAFAVSARAAGEQKVALLPVIAMGLSADEADGIEDVIQRALEVQYGKRALPRPVVRERLEKGGAKSVHCNRIEPGCSAQIAALTEADLAVVAMVGANSGAWGEHRVLELRLIDVAKAIDIAFVRSDVALDAKPADIARAIAALDAPDARATHLIVNGPAEATKVLVDGADRGSLPAHIDDLAPGKHEIGVPSVSFTVTTSLEPGQVVTVDVPKVARAVPDVHATNAAPLQKSIAPNTRPVTASGGALPTASIALFGGGAVLAIGGVVALLVGEAPLLAANGDASTLRSIESEARANPAVVDQQSSRINATSADLARNDAAWSSYGLATSIAGGVAIAAAAAAIAGGVVFFSE